MTMTAKQAEIDRSALIIVDMQNDFLHPDGGFAHLAREHPEANIDMPFLRGTIPHVSRLAERLPLSRKTGGLCRSRGQTRLFRCSIPLLAH